MGFAARLSIGILLVITGAVLALGFADAEFLFLTGQWLGLALLVLGAFDIHQAYRSRPQETRPDQPE